MVPHRAATTLRPLAEAMEERILHSADVAPLLLSGAAHDTRTIDAACATASQQPSEIVFIDASLPDAAGLRADLLAQQAAGRHIEIVTIESGTDGLALITQTLAGRHDIGAVHVLAHGSDGQLQLGSSTLDQASLLARAAEVAVWSSALAPGADLLLYGCDLAETALGQHLVKDLAALTGADVAASTDLTGAAARGGNWTLEYSTGRIDAKLAPSPWEQTNWQGVMATYTVTTTADVVGATLLPGSLRWAISQANANPGTDTISFAVNGTFNIKPGSTGNNNNSSGNFYITDSVNLVGNGTGNTIINGNGVAGVFNVKSGVVSMSGMTIQGGASKSGGGIFVQQSAALTLNDVVVQNNLGLGGQGAGINNQGALTLTNVIVRNNGDAFSGADGAGIYNNRGSITATNVQIIGNNAAGHDGGGLYDFESGGLVLNGVTISGNNASAGGGIYSHSNAASLVNVTISGNSAWQGGGIWADRVLSLDHVTVAANSALVGSGGGIFVKGSTVTATNSLFAGNVGGNANMQSTLISLGYNLSDDASPGFGAVGDKTNVPAGLQPLANNGGFTSTMAIGAASAARDAANPVTTLTADQRGIAYFGGRADIGAYEYSPNGFAPTISAVPNQTIDEDTTLAPVTFTIGDADTSVNSLVVTATSGNTALVPNASIVLGGSGASRTVSLTPAANANSSANGGPATITLSVSDGINVTSTSFAVTVRAVNDAPTVALPAAQSVPQGTNLIFTGANAITVADIDAGTAPLQVTLTVAHGKLQLNGSSGLSFVIGNGNNEATMTFAGSLANINAALDGMKYTPAGGYNGPDRLDIAVNDLGNSGSGGARSTSGSVAITVTAVNQAPVLGLPGAQATALPAPLSFSGVAGNAITVSDPDAGGAPLQVTLSTANVSNNGTLSFGSLANVSLISGTGSNDTTVVLRGSATDLNAALGTLKFSATAAGAAQIDVTLNDLGNTGAGGALQVSGAVAITVGNDALPVLTLSQTSRSFTEGSGQIALDPSLTLSDADNATLASAQVRIGAGYASGEDLLAFSNDGSTMGNIAGSFNAGVLSLTSAGQTASVAQWQAALRSVTYANASTAPSTAPRTVTLTVNDGIADSAQHQILLGVVAVNDAPVLTGSNDLAAIAEDVTTNVGSLVSTLIAGHVSDADNSGMAGIAVTAVDNSHGSWQYTTDGTNWLAFGSVGDGTALLLAADTNTAVRFVPDASWNGTVAGGLRFRAWDQSAGSAGGVANASVNGGSTAFSSATAASGITVTPVNDPPVQLLPIANASATQGAAFTFALPAGTFTDPDVGDTLVYSATPSSGGVLPSWLTFDAATQTFSGTPGNHDVGSFNVRVTATDGSNASAFGDFSLTVANVNDPPVLAQPIANQSATQGAAFGFTLPAGTFADPDTSDTLSYGATLSAGGALPSWLAFDTATQTFSGTPANGDVGAISVRVTATDTSNATAFGDFTLTVANVNDAPALAQPIANQSATQGAAFGFTLPAGTFTDPDIGDTLSYSAKLSSGAALPSWLAFDTATQTFSGTPANGDVGAITLRVTATDTSNATAFGDFTLTVANVNDAPALAQPIANQAATQGAAFGFTLPAGTFTDPDIGDTLSYSVKLSSGAALPSWLSFNAVTQTFSGTPANGDVGAITLRVTATDTSNATAFGDFTLTVANVNDAPALAQPIANQSATQGAAIGFTLPAGTFADPDTGDTLSYSAKLSSGAALPSWLSFNTATRTFSGTPANADVGAMTVRVTATDTSSAAAFGDFTLTVANVNDAPVLAQSVVDQAATQDAAFAFTLPAGTFTDPDIGDTLTYSARLASGAALPKWLSFDAATRTLSGTPANADVSTLNLVVTATDRGGLAVSSNDFALVVANVNDAPVLARAIGTQTAAPNVVFGFAVPAATFTDPDVGDTLSYSASLATGGPLPAWLSFDPATKSFVGKPIGGDVGQYAVRLTATDSAGAAAQAVFVIRVAAPMPTLPSPTPDAAPAPAVAAPAPDSVQTTAATSTKAVAAASPSPGRLGATDDVNVSSDKGAETSIVVTSPRGDDAALAATRPGSRSDAVLADAVTPQFSELTATPLAQLLRNDDLQRKFEEMQRQMDEGADTRRTIAESGVVLSAGLSIGYVVWLVRGGVLLSSVLSALPAWQMVDPLPVLAATRKDDRRGAGQPDEPEVERLFDEPSAASAPVGRDALASRPARPDKNATLRTAGTPADPAGSKETRG